MLIASNQFDKIQATAFMAFRACLGIRMEVALSGEGRMIGERPRRYRGVPEGLSTHQPTFSRSTLRAAPILAARFVADLGRTPPVRPSIGFCRPSQNRLQRSPIGILKQALHLFRLPLGVDLSDGLGKDDRQNG
jgi:hypothetical protein